MIEKLERVKQNWLDLDMTDMLVEFTDKINELVEVVNKLEKRIEDLSKPKVV